MSASLALSGEGSLWWLPSFMRFEASAGEFMTLDQTVITSWWLPARSDDDAADFATGTVYFAQAVSLARNCGSTRDALSQIINAMVKCGPCELGFLDAVARKATVGAVPLRITDDMAASSVQLAAGKLSIASLREGELEARDCLDMARQMHFPEMIAMDLEGIVEARFTKGAVGFLWTVCGAAMLGGAN